MSDWEQLESRLAASLDRISDAAAKLQPAGVDDADAEADAAEIENLRKQLSEERAANARLVEGLESLKKRQDTEVADMEERLKAATESDAEKSAVQRELKARVEELRDQVARLTEANRAMVGQPELVNSAMMAELEAMRASRRADVSELDEILAHLEPHLEGGAHA